MEVMAFILILFAIITVEYFVVMAGALLWQALRYLERRNDQIDREQGKNKQDNRPWGQK